MMNAYDRMYLDKARIAMGCMLDSAVNQMRLDIDKYFELFIASGIAKRFENGDVSIIAGKSGREIFCDVMICTSGLETPIVWERMEDKSQEYWAGWALVYYQWIKNIPFAEIVKYISLSEIVKMYYPYHEMDIRQFVDKMDEIYTIRQAETKLKERRIKLEMSQSDLAAASGVPLRTIQQYEQRQKDINKAAIVTVSKLARALYCSAEDLIEN